MTLSGVGDTVCNIVQCFPILLILAQKRELCLKTPLIYKPPEPKPSVTYHEALDILINALNAQDYGHQGHNYHHNHHGYGDVYGQPHYNKPFYFMNSDPNGHKGHDFGNTGLSTKPIYVYGTYGSNHKHITYSGVPSMGRKTTIKVLLPVKGQPTVYASGHKYGDDTIDRVVKNVNKYKIVVKKKRKARPIKIKALSRDINEESCVAEDGGVGYCRPLMQCQPYLQLLQNVNENTKRILRKAHCGFEGNYPKVCCPLEFEIPPEVPVEEPPNDVIDQLPEPPECGSSNITLGRVVNGVNAKLGALPWMALLGYKGRGTGAGPRWLCGGSLVTRRHVLTAAHCVHGREDDLYVVRLGELDLQRDDDGANPVDILIKQKIRHEDFNPKSVTNDIALLVLEKNAPLSWQIKPICLPTLTELRAKSFERYQPFIAGWGDTQYRGPSASHLQVLQLPVVSNVYCKNAYSAYKAQIIDDRVLCAGFEKGGKDACQGDSGGPLMQPVLERVHYTSYFYQIGVVSYGKKCAEAGYPGVYTRVTHFIPWLQKNIIS